MNTGAASAPEISFKFGNVRMVAAMCAVVCALIVADGWRMIAYMASIAPGTLGLVADRVILIVAALLMLIVVGSGVRRGLGTGRAFLAGSACGTIFFASSLGTAILDPQSIAWMLHGNDWTAHYAGWAMYRNAPWTWPPGALPNLMYPRGTSIIFADSLPIVSFLLKPFSPLLPQTFQFTGLWFALSCLLQGGFGALLARRWTRHPAIILAAAAMFLYAPVLLNRLPHATLMAHWLILASLWLYFRPTPPRNVAAEMWPWWSFALIAAGTMPYLTAMVMAILLAYCVRRCRVDRERTLLQAASMFVIAIAVVLTMWWLSGAFILKPHNASGGVPYGVYSFNLLGFFNSYGWSMVLPGLPTESSAQMEGYSYLGLGVIALIVLIVLEAIAKLRRPHWPRTHWPLLVVTLLTVAFAASTVLRIGPWTLIDRPLDTALLAMFRSSGRFIWVAYYLTILAAIVLTLKRFGATAASAVLAGALGLQMYDYTSSHRQAAQLRAGVNWPPPMKTLDDPGWDQMAVNRLHLTLLPPAPCGDPPGPILPMQLVAARNHLTYNTAYVSRWNPEDEYRYCDRLTDQLAKGDLHSDELYVVADAWLDRFQHAAKTPTCRMLDGYRACVVDAAP